MAIYRNIQMSFWTDPVISDDFTPEDKLFYLYVLTNTHTNLCGCYEISIKQMAYELGYSYDKTIELLERAATTLKTVAYSRPTKELLVIRWSKYNWTSSDKFRVLLDSEINSIKCGLFKNYLTGLFKGTHTVSDFFDMVATDEQYGIPEKSNSTISVTDTVTDTVKKDNTAEDNNTVKQVVDYLNEKCGTRFKAGTAETKKHIVARIHEGYKLEDFKKVIDTKSAEWAGTNMAEYLRPQTLFGTKFESYLNQKSGTAKKKAGNNYNNFSQREYDYDELERLLLNRDRDG